MLPSLRSVCKTSPLRHSVEGDVSGVMWPPQIVQCGRELLRAATARGVQAHVHQCMVKESRVLHIQFSHAV